MINSSKYDLKSYGIQLEGAKEVTGQNAIRTLCPKCSADRSTAAHRREPVLYVNLYNGCCTCHNCGASWRMDSKEYLEKREKARQLALQKRDFKRPAPHPLPDFSEPVLRYLTEQRHIPIWVLRDMLVTEQVELMPQTGRQEHCIVFNYWEQGQLVNQKFRDLQKHFKMVSGAELVPYNVDSCIDQDSVIITEGEMDALSFVAADFSSVISIPSGALSNSDWMNRFYELYFADKTHVYIATDMDAPGQKAADELIRRFGPEVCLRVRFSEGCKDANEELQRHGPESLQRCIREARPVPLPDVNRLPDFEEQLDALYKNGPESGKLTGWKNLDRLVQFGTGQLALVTGRTNDGKSEWLDELVLRLMLRTGWNGGYWTPENTILDHSVKLIEKLTDRSFQHHDSVGVQPEQYHLCKQWLQERVSWIDLSFDNLRLDTILDRCRSLVRKFNVRVLVLDPFNFIEKENDAIRSENAWDSHVVGALRSFAIEHNVLLFLVAHPRKVEMQLDGRKRRITLEDISGTADFGNKADYCFCIDRDDERKVVTISIDKVRRKQYGSKGRQAYFVYKPHSGRYCPCELNDDKTPVNTDFQSDAGMWLRQRDLFGQEEPPVSQ